jgi:SWI/SNF-related matrix-associated actin-dependent regulator of chromatin subfamily A3
MNTTAAPSLSNLSLSSYSSSNPIDLTLEEDDDSTNDPYSVGRLPKRQRTEQSSMDSFSAPSSSLSNNYPYLSSPQLPSISRNSMSNIQRQIPSPSPIKPGFLQSPIGRSSNSPSNGISQAYRPAFAGSSAFFHNGRSSQTSVSPHYSSAIVSSQTPPSAHRQVIDLTGSPSPPPSAFRQLAPSTSNLPHDLPPKTPVCIGQLTVTALVLYPVPYLRQHESGSGDAEWATVQLRYEHNPNKPGGSETIHIMTPRSRAPNGEAVQGEGFGVVEQKVATSLGPMLGKGLIRLDGKVRKGMPNVSPKDHIPDQMLRFRNYIASYSSFTNASLYS